MSTVRRGSFDAVVVSNQTICREHYRLTLRVDAFPETRPGQFVQLACRPGEAGEVNHDFDWSPGGALPDIAGAEFVRHDAFLRRPFSIAGRRDVGGAAEIDVIGREVGPGTRFLSLLEDGNRLSLLGPLGNTFTLPGEAGGIALLVGGGVGIPPMIYLAQALAPRIVDNSVKAIAFAGAITRELLALTIIDDTADPTVPQTEPLHQTAEFSRYGVPTTLTTDDGSIGQRGYVTDALERYLDLAITSGAARALTTIYTCGPEPMMKRVQQIAAARGIACQIAVERAMACGMGTCQSCCIRVKKPDPARPPLAGQDWCYRLACTDGPVFTGEELMW